MEGTVLGGLLNPKLDWRFIVPFIPWGSLYANPQDPEGQDLWKAGIDELRKRIEERGPCAALFGGKETAL
jgi:hypothetical protein